MNENSLLALLAKLCGDIGINDNQDAGAILELQQAVASAIINEPALSFSNSFQFEQLDHFSTHHLDTANLEQLNNVLQRVQENQQLIDTSIRIFRRRVPFVSSQLRDSVPEWARGAQIA